MAKPITMKKLAVGLLLFFTLLNTAAQETFVREPSATRYIKDLYQYVREKINRNQYYVNEFKINSSNLKWADEQHFQTFTRHFYSFVGDDSPVLRLVMLTTKVGDKHYYSEFAYDNDGSLVYAYEKQNDTLTYAYREIHVYLDRDLCLNLILDQEVIDVKNTAPYTDKIKILTNSGKYHAQRFAKDMQGIGFGK
jgi:hypothetical protein